MTRDHDLCVLDDVTALRATDAALLVQVPVDVPRVGKEPVLTMKEVWIPHRFVHDDSEVWKPGDKGTLVIPEWLALDRGVA